MKKFLFLTIMTVNLFLGCSDDYDLLPFGDELSQRQSLKITTRALKRLKPSYMQEFSGSSTLGLYITSGNVDSLRKGATRYKNVKAEAIKTTNGNIKWRHTPIVRLDSRPVTIYAYSPYREEACMNPTCIPIKISHIATQTEDYMYGTHAKGQKAVNGKSPIVMLSMDHALSLLYFQVNLSEEVKNNLFRLESIQIGNKPGGSAFANKGTMDVTTGEITYTPCTFASTVLKLDTPTCLTLNSNKIHRFMVMPIAKPIKHGDIEVLFYINGKRYIFLMPAETHWEGGYTYLYKLCFTGKDMLLKKVKIKKWPQGYNRDFIGYYL